MTQSKINKNDLYWCTKYIEMQQIKKKQEENKLYLVFHKMETTLKSISILCSFV